MHQLSGARYAGCTAVGAAGRYGPMRSGGGMMDGYYRIGGWSAMMSSRDYNWMMGGAGRYMSRSDWQRRQRQWLGTGASAGQHGWSAGATAAVALGSALLAALLAILAVRRRRFRRPPQASSSS